MSLAWAALGLVAAAAAVAATDGAEASTADASTAIVGGSDGEEAVPAGRLASSPSSGSVSVVVDVVPVAAVGVRPIAGGSSSSSNNRAL